MDTKKTNKNTAFFTFFLFCSQSKTKHTLFGGFFGGRGVISFVTEIQKRLKMALVNRKSLGKFVVVVKIRFSYFKTKKFRWPLSSRDGGKALVARPLKILHFATSLRGAVVTRISV